MPLNAAKSQPVEERRLRWTTWSNSNTWFDSWESDLVSLGFAFKNDEDETIIPEDQKRNILNLDETCLGMDGNKGGRGGRPSVVFYDPSLPKLGKRAVKSSLTTTMITGSNAIGEPLPPHFQFSTKATSGDRQKVRNEVLKYMLGVRATFGNDEERVWPATYGLNEKGGMDDCEFEKYIRNSIIPLYPNAEDSPGKRVMIKIDSGPGRLNADLLARLQLLGFVLYPGVPKTTAVTQETDQTYGMFKNVFFQNLDQLTKFRANQNESMSLQPWIVGILVFGGVDGVTGMVIEKNAFYIAFTTKRNIEAWEKFGTCPLTQACLELDKV